MTYIATRLMRDNTEEEEREFTCLAKAIDFCSEDGMVYWANIYNDLGELIWEY